MSHVAVTGGSGLVGANLVRELVQTGSQVRAIVHSDSRALEGLPVERVQCDIRDARAASEAVAGAEFVYHLAGSISVGQLPAQHVRAVNVDGTENVVRACRRGGVERMIHCSSIHALDHRPDDLPVDEERPLWADPRRCSVYDWSKASAERAVLEAVRQGLDAVIVNPTAIIGPYDFRPSWMGQLIARMAHGRQPVLLSGGFDWVDARDVAAGAAAAARRGRTGERYLLSGHWCSLPEMAAIVAEASGRAPRYLTIPLGWAQALAYPYSHAVGLLGRVTPFTPEALEAVRHCRLVSNAKANRELGYAPRALRETLEDTVAWLDEHARSARA